MEFGVRLSIERQAELFQVLASGSTPPFVALGVAAVGRTTLMGLVIVHAAELARLVPVLIAPLTGSIGVVESFLIGRVVVVASALVGVVCIDTTFLDGRVDIALGCNRGSENGKQCGSRKGELLPCQATLLSNQ